MNNNRQRAVRCRTGSAGIMGRWRPLVVGLAAALAAACGTGSDSDDTATEAAEAADTTTTTEMITTTSESTTTTEATTTTTEAPTPGKANAVGERISGLDVALGAVAPTITGHDYLTGDEVHWGGQDKPAAVLFAPLADWCPHCHQHVEALATYAADNPGPDGAQVLLVTTRDSQSAQYPQNEWLTELGWRYPTVLSNLDFSIDAMFGVTSVPTWFLVGSDGTIVEVLDGHHVSPADVFTHIDALE